MTNKSERELHYLKIKPSVVTVCFLTEKKKILLGFKKIGFGAGVWNGFGGKVEQNETVEEAAIREMQEESGVAVYNLKHKGKLLCAFTNKEKVFEIHIYTTNQYRKEPKETNEMRPQWFDLNAVPYKDMWIGDQYWLPQVLAGKKVDAFFLFTDTKEIAEFRTDFS